MQGGVAGGRAAEEGREPPRLHPQQEQVHLAAPQFYNNMYKYRNISHDMIVYIDVIQTF